MTTLLLALALSQDLSEAARKAQADFEKVKKDLDKAGTELQAKLETARREYAEADSRGDKAKCEEIKKNFETARAAILKPLDAFLESLNASIKAAPDDVGLLDVRMNLYELKSDPDGVADDAVRTAKLRPDDLDKQNRAAAALYRVNRYQAALEASDRVLAKDAKNVEAAAMKALCDFSLDKFDEASQLLAGVDLQKIPRAFQGVAQMVAQSSKEYAGFLKKELEIRAAEAKAGDLPRVTLTTSKGEIELELFENEAPNAVANFISLVESKFYDGQKFHRVIPNFMVQGGDPLSKDDDPSNDGTGGPGYKFKDELEAGKYRNHFRGSLSLANSGPNTNGSQFFITHLPTGHLNGKHVVFGRTLKGQEVVEAIRQGDVLTKAVVTRKRKHEYKPVTEK